MIVLIFSTIVNIVLDPLLIFGIWKFPSLGVMGSAYAAIIGNGLSVVIFLYLCFSGRSVISLRHVERRVNWSAMGKILNLGGFSAMQGFLRDVSRVMFIGFVAAHGTYAVAAYAICMRLRLFVMNPGFGISNAVGPMVGQNLGANQIERAEQSARVASRLAVAIMGFTGIVFFLFPRYFVGIFSDQTAEVLEIGIVFLRWLSATFGFIAASLVLGRALNGAGDTMTPMVITGVSQLGIGLLLVFILSHLVGMVGIWMGIALSNVVQGLIMWFWFNRGTWKTKKLVHGK
jgi:putative MATE family efflux protein